VQGRWSLTEPLLRGEVDPSARRRAIGELLLERYGIVTREQVLAEGLPGGFSAIYAELSQLETLGVARRGYFLEGLGGAQFALPGAVERLRARGAGGAGTGAEGAPPLVLAAVDPAQPYGAALPWPKRRGDEDESRSGRRPARVAGAYVVLAGGDPIVYLERGGRALQTLVAAADARIEPALSALVDHVRAGAIKRVGLEKVDGEPAMSSPLGPALIALGFQEGPRRLTLSA
jgi:ATP-dependent helicase Lhr and Lhr-like helicase